MKTTTLPQKSKHTQKPALTGRAFKSGNSSALRLPVGLNVVVGKSYVLTKTPSGFVATDPAALAKRRKNMAALFGSAPDFPLRDA